MRIGTCIFAVVMAAFAAGAATAQETAADAEQGAPPPAAWGFAFELGLGTETLPIDPREPPGPENQATYQKLAFMPELSFGKLGLGLDLTVHFNLRPGQDGSDVEIYEPDWLPAKADKTFLELYLPKIAYIRWGQKGDPLYAKLGSFDDGTLGNGFIMGNYSNTRFLPERRIFGAALDVDGSLFNFPYLGIETFAGNLANFDVLGTRLYARPLAAQDLPVLKNLQVGTTAATDLDPYRYAGTEFVDALGDADPVSMFGVDARLPIISNPALSLSAYSDLAFQPKGRWGSMAGAGGVAFGFLLYQAQLRLLGPDFVPTYFDGAYDLFRHIKYLSMAEDPSGDPYAGWLAGLGFTFLSNAVVFNTTVDGPFKRPPEEVLEAGIADYPHLRSTFTLAEGILAGFSFQALYEKYFLGADEPLGTGNFWRDLTSRENAVIGAQINYRTGPAVISLLYSLRYDPTIDDYIVTSSLMSSVRF